MPNPTADPALQTWRTASLLLIVIALGLALGRMLSVNAVDLVRLERYLREQQVAARARSFETQAAARYQAEGLAENDIRARIAAERVALRAAAGRQQDAEDADDEAAGRTPKWRKQRPFLSSNDRSRWCTIRALVEHGTYAIDDIVSQPNWDTIDMVKHDAGRGNCGPDEGRLYSSKPPLLPTLLAGPYWVLHKLTGCTLGTHPFALGRTLLALYNLPCFAAFLLALRWLADRLTDCPFSRLLLVAAAGFATYLTTFCTVLNNHLPAAAAVALALVPAVQIWYDGDRRLRTLFLAGLLAAFAAANELPALSFLAALAVGLLWKAPRETLLGFLPGAAVVAAAFFATNYAAHGVLRPPYTFRSDARDELNWYKYEYRRGDRVLASYWQQPGGIDRGESSPATYALHATVGHHGIFTLTPFWLLTLVGLPLGLALPRHRLRPLALLITLLSVVCLAFYLTRPLADRNYGGMTSAFRWVFWLAPLWLVGSIPVLERLSQRRWGRALALLLLALSAASAAWPTWNPFTHPWFMEFMLWQAWTPPLT